MPKSLKSSTMEKVELESDCLSLPPLKKLWIFSAVKLITELESSSIISPPGASPESEESPPEGPSPESGESPPESEGSSHRLEEPSYEFKPSTTKSEELHCKSPKSSAKSSEPSSKPKLSFEPKFSFSTSPLADSTSSTKPAPET